MESAYELDRLRGHPVFDRDGEEVGKVEDIYVDDSDGRPEWVAVGAGTFGMRHVLVPFDGATERDGGLAVPYSKAAIERSPDVDERSLSPERELELYEYYRRHGQAA